MISLSRTHVDKSVWIIKRYYEGSVIQKSDKLFEILSEIHILTSAKLISDNTCNKGKAGFLFTCIFCVCFFFCGEGFAGAGCLA